MPQSPFFTTFASKTYTPVNTKTAANVDKVILGIDPGTNMLGYGVLHVVGRQTTMEAMGIIDLRKVEDMYLKLGRIHERVIGIIESFKPDEMAIEAPFFGKNIQSMLKLGRAQGVAIAAAISRDIPIHEYAPMKIKMAILPYMDATDALAAAYCHYLQGWRQTKNSEAPHSWAALARKQGKLPHADTTGPEQKLRQLLKK